MASPEKIALVTGAGSGVGRATALALMKAGYTVVLAGRRKDALEATAAEGKAFGGRALVVPADVGDPASVKALFAKTKEAFGRLDVLFNNAGIGAPAVPMEDLTFEQWKTVVDTNLTGAFLCTQEAIRIMKAQIAARRAHHQQRLDLGACAAPELGALHRDQARHHRPHQVDRRSTGASYDIACGQIDIGNAATEMTERMTIGRAAGRRLDRRSSRAWTPSTSPTPSSTWRACRSTRTCCS